MLSASNWFYINPIPLTTTTYTHTNAFYWGVGT